MPTRTPKRTTKRAAATSREISRPAPRAGRGTGTPEKRAPAAARAPKSAAPAPTPRPAQKSRRTSPYGVEGLIDVDKLRSGQKLVAKYRGEKYTATVVAGGFLVKGRTYKSLSAAGGAITGNSVNGRRFWSAA